MNRDLFIEQLKNAKLISREEIDSIIVDSINSSSKDGNPRGHLNLIITMEELSELSKEVAKELRGEGNNIGILEELADVQICIYYLQEIIGISDCHLAEAISVKMERLKFKLNAVKEMKK